LLTIVVAGGGFAGVETIAGLNDFLHDAIRYYPNLRRDQIRVVLVHPEPVILPELNPSLGRYAQKKLEERGVEIRLNCKVTGYDGILATLSDGEVVACKTLIWTAGTTPSMLLSDLPCEKQRGRLVVDETLELKDRPGVWALRSHSRPQARRLLSSDRPARFARRACGGPQHRRLAARGRKEGVFFLHHRAIGSHWPAHRRG
jgi:NADH dehydrogenase